MKTKDKITYGLIVCGTLITLSLLIYSTNRSSVPSLRMVKEILLQKIEQQSEGRIKLLEIEQTSGQAHESNGSLLYTLEYKGKIEFLERCFWGPLGPNDNWQGDCYTYLGGPTPWWLKSGVSIRQATKGHQEPISGMIVFQKKMNFWHMIVQEKDADASKH